MEGGGEERNDELYCLKNLCTQLDLHYQEPDCEPSVALYFGKLYAESR